MAWEWLTSISTGVVGVAGIAGTVWVGRRTTAAERSRSREAKYAECLGLADQAIDVLTEWSVDNAMLKKSLGTADDAKLKRLTARADTSMEQGIRAAQAFTFAAAALNLTEPGAVVEALVALDRRIRDAEVDLLERESRDLTYCREARFLMVNAMRGELGNDALTSEHI